MKFHDLDQGSREWVDFRRTHLGASDSPSILELYKKGTRAELMREKLSGKGKFQTQAMKRGHELEPEARSIFENQMGIIMPPAVATHDVLEYMSASLDGINEPLKCILEIKTGVHGVPQNGKIPASYMAQIQHQLFVTDYDLCYYCYFDGENIEIINIHRDDELITQIVRECGSFWKELCHKLNSLDPEPEPMYLPLTHPRAISIAEELYDIIERCKVLSARKEELREALLDFAPDQNFEVSGVRFSRTTGRSSYDYEAMEKDGIDVAKYKKAGKPSWTMNLVELEAHTVCRKDS